MFSVMKIYSFWCHPFQEQSSGLSGWLTLPWVVLLSCAHRIYFLFVNLSLCPVFLLSLSVLRCGQYRELTPCIRKYSRIYGHVELREWLLNTFSKPSSLYSDNGLKLCTDVPCSHVSRLCTSDRKRFWEYDILDTDIAHQSLTLL